MTALDTQRGTRLITRKGGAGESLSSRAHARAILKTLPDTAETGLRHGSNAVQAAV